MEPASGTQTQSSKRIQNQKEKRKEELVMRRPSTSNDRWIRALLKEEKEIISTLNRSNDQVRIDVLCCNEKLCEILKKASIEVANAKEKANNQTCERIAAALKAISPSKHQNISIFWYSADAINFFVLTNLQRQT